MSLAQVLNESQKSVSGHSRLAKAALQHLTGRESNGFAEELLNMLKPVFTVFKARVRMDQTEQSYGSIL